MRISSNTARFLLAVALALGISACASTSYPGQGPAAVIRVNNEDSNIPRMTVYLISSVGTSEYLGDVGFDSVSDFELKSARLVGTYRVLARPEGRPEVYSPEFNLARGDVVEWNLRMRRVFFRGNVEG